MAHPLLSIDYLIANDEQAKAAIGSLVDSYNKPADDDALQRAKAALEARPHHVKIVNTKAEALEAVKAIIPKGAKVHNTSSISLSQIGYIDYAKTTTDFVNLHTAILAESDPAKQAQLRREAAIADYVVSSPVAVSEEGDIVVADLTGTRIAPIVSSGEVIFVTGANKVVPTYDAAIKRLYEYTLPAESSRLRFAYNTGPQGRSNVSNLLAIRGGNPFGKPRVHVIIVKEPLGF